VNTSLSTLPPPIRFLRPHSRRSLHLFVHFYVWTILVCLSFAFIKLIAEVLPLAFQSSKVTWLLFFWAGIRSSDSTRHAERKSNPMVGFSSRFAHESWHWPPYESYAISHVAGWPRRSRDGNWSFVTDHILRLGKFSEICPSQPKSLCALFFFPRFINWNDHLQLKGCMIPTYLLCLWLHPSSRVSCPFF
jgi:hypothetical protein